ncbi:hypothetical protein ElyMa_004909300 [Elysia marginata]|uniref:Uncharacterized protein n=1 Tax=Elysia marginata TaxID=1093978 RepID=A0AAV4IWM5_9GAST|nr:hypothetical protein ElyMa_004909300 [Elysia marginata]
MGAAHEPMSPAPVNQGQATVLTPLNITIGVQSTAIHPLNRDILSQTDFSPLPADREQDIAAAADGTEAIQPRACRSSDQVAAADLLSGFIQQQKTAR